MELPANKILPSVGRSFYSKEKTQFAKANDFLLRFTTEAQGLTPRLPIPTFAEIYSGKNDIQLPEDGSNDFSPAVLPQIAPKTIQPVNNNSVQPDTWNGNTSNLESQAIQNPNLGKVKLVDTGNNNITEPTTDNNTESWLASHKLAVILVILLIILLIVFLKN